VGRACHGRRHRAPGELFIPFHYGWGAQSANQHTWYARDAMSPQPQLKAAPVAIRRKGFGALEQWMLDRYDDLSGKSIEPYAAGTIGGTINEEFDPPASAESSPGPSIRKQDTICKPRRSELALL
jgi:hypothetical protein